ncbi:MAG TPA: hypothetical protein DDX91_02085, partial [Ruminococcaceae bacterium]|nr:hypothetical protein [Oscillospiraceae bacterium]
AAVRPQDVKITKKPNAVHPPQERTRKANLKAVKKTAHRKVKNTVDKFITTLGAKPQKDSH